MIDYYDLPSVSNSDLGELRKRLYDIDELPNKEFHFAFGSLVDAMLTEPVEVEKCKKAYPFTPDDLVRAYKMVNYCNEDSLIKLLLQHTTGQHVFVRTHQFTFDQWLFKMKCRCKLDLYSKKMRLGIDFKTLSVASEKAFKASIDFFDYDRQAAFYMDLGKIDRFWIIGISKVNSQIYKLAIERGDEMYESGRSKYSYWAYKYYKLIYNLNF